jgi:hypothetical protein
MPLPCVQPKYIFDQADVSTPCAGFKNLPCKLVTLIAELSLCLPSIQNDEQLQQQIFPLPFRAAFQDP